MYQKYNQQLNLNYLRTFNAIYSHRSIKKAANALGITQSAVSQTLAKLREFTNDKLFYTAGNELHATYRADEIGQGLNEHIELLDNRLSSRLFSDPHQFDGELTIAVSSVFLEAIATELTSSVVFDMFPNAKLNVTTWNDKTFNAIQNGEVHIGLNFYPIETPKSIRSVALTTSDPVVIARKEHPWEHSGFSQREFSTYPTGGILVPGLTDFSAILERQYPGKFDFQYRSASMSVLSCLAEHSDILAITETLSASMCPKSIQCFKPRWLSELLPNKISHAMYYLERNHHHPLYQYSSELIKKSLQHKLDELSPNVIEC
ncbi:LysR family transcriptional regulator [Vibrio sp. ZSDE26]|uniref:LysR family transcriptional regulator n=1 Tax=Vibrio amylolyticus TaxID=2847292 RepID=A0A9X1XM75_9VIBR|nr:LysR family transcriptional regulator [Vibrio amylolyticus]MCK6263455.1 LysR family transcriptional regulator [Vibrio amylolyticus]